MQKVSKIHASKNFIQWHGFDEYQQNIKFNKKSVPQKQKRHRRTKEMRSSNNLGKILQNNDGSGATNKIQLIIDTWYVLAKFFWPFLFEAGEEICVLK